MPLVYQVVSLATPRMAASQTTDRQEETTQYAVARDRFERMTNNWDRNDTARADQR